jgi:hypothetical protein
LNGDPFIGLDAGDGEPRLDLNQFPSLSGSASSKMAEGAQGMNRKPVRFKKPGAERKDIFRVVEIVGWQGVNSLGQEKTLDR